MTVWNKLHYQLKSSLCITGLTIGLVGIIACSAAPLPASKAPRDNAPAQHPHTREHGGRCGSTESYELILKESSEYIDEVAGRVAGRFVKCELEFLNTNESVQVAQRIQEHLVYRLTHRDNEMYKSNSKFLENWLEQHRKGVNQAKRVNKLETLKSLFVMSETSVLKKELNYVTKAAVHGILTLDDMTAFADKFNAHISQLAADFDYITQSGTLEKWRSQQIRNNLEDIQADIRYLETGNFCRSVSMDLFLLIEDKANDTCEIDPIQH